MRVERKTSKFPHALDINKERERERERKARTDRQAVASVKRERERERRRPHEVCAAPFSRLLRV